MRQLCLICSSISCKIRSNFQATVTILNLTLSRRSANVGFNYTLNESALNGRVLFEYLFMCCKAQMFLQRF